ncbi:MAG: HAD-superfamily hydrolase, subfamily variant 3 [Chloroflexi bacterium]|nr:HAD-superfamily hydrolase, subfamily variant 3 [Chloroflexota bacterium]
MTQELESRPSIEVLLLDVGGVLSPSPSHLAIAEVEARLGMPPGILSPLLYDGEPWTTLSTGGMTEDEYWQILADRLHCDPDELQAIARPVWGPEGGGGVDAALVDLARAAGRHVHLAILSNATLHLEAFLDAYGISDMFDPILNSARIGLRKPDLRCYQYALDVLGVPAPAVLFVDDKLRNTDAARELGITCLEYTGAASLAEALVEYGVLRADEVEFPSLTRL